ncbi:MAG: hypothetical protein SPI49_03500 [Eubacteriales bacterium]|nr:hypothetical protein [Eubacteriales bacterium]
MIEAICITATITILFMCVIFQIKIIKVKDKQNKNLMNINGRLNEQLSLFSKKEQQRRENSMYDFGLIDGKKSVNEESKKDVHEFKWEK